MKILITGCAGFIGFSIASQLLKKKAIVYGIDNFDNYYSVKLKRKRSSHTVSLCSDCDACSPGVGGHHSRAQSSE